MDSFIKSIRHRMFMNKIELKEIILDQNRERKEEKLIEREVFSKIKDYAKNRFVIIISGIRRSGKSTLLSQIKNKYPGYYLNFDDDRLVNFKLENFQILYETLIEIYGEKNNFYFDEIQNIAGWERFVRRLHDEREKVFVTGSNASMLSRELGTHLTGRHLEMNLFPFSFREFLNFKEFSINKKSIYLTKEKAKIKKYFEEYLLEGGLPEYLKTNNKEYLKTLYDNILYRDIIVRYKLSNEKIIKELVYLAVTNIAKEISFNSMKKLLGFGSSTTVKEYFSYLENSFLIFLVPKFDYSLKKQVYSNKKVYVIDNGLAVNLGFRFSKDSGKLLENLVFVELKRKGREIFYYSNKHECDFVIRDKMKIKEAIQVCYEFNEENKKREIEGLVEAMENFKLKNGLILTYDQNEEFIFKKKNIKVISVWKWLLEE